MRMFARCTAALLGMTAGALLLAPSSAHGGTALLSCEGEQKATYSPAMTKKEQLLTATVAENYHCLLAPEGISDGNGAASFKEKASCLATVQPNQRDVIQYTWNNRQISTVEFKVTNVDRLANGTTSVTSVGKVTSGLGKGSTATRVVILPSLDSDACFEGVESQKGRATLKFVGAP